MYVSEFPQPIAFFPTCLICPRFIYCHCYNELELPMQQSRAKSSTPESPSAEPTTAAPRKRDRQRSGLGTPLVLLVTLAGCAGGTISLGGFSGGGGGGVGVGVSAPIGGSVDRSPYVVSEGEQVIQPGMTSSEVIQRLGHPYYQFGVRQDNATVWNYRMRYGSCLIYQVSILPNGIVKDAGTASDPACDVPDRRRW